MTTALKEVVNTNSWKRVWKIRKFADDAAHKADTPYAVETFEGNTLLNQGIAEMIDLLIGAGGTTVYSNANAHLGVGDSSDPEDAADTDLQAGANKFYQPCDATYPQRSGSVDIVARSTFASGDANYAWEEFTLANGSSGAAENFNRKISSQGTKTAGQTWELTLTITITAA